MSVQATKLIQTIIVTMGLAAPATLVHAQERDIQGIYSSKKYGCGSGSQTNFAIMTGRIVGPGFDCKLRDIVPGAGTGVVAYEAACTVDGKPIEVTRKRAATSAATLLALDLGNNPDHFNVSIPGREDWIPLYPCSPVPGLN